MRKTTYVLIPFLVLLIWLGIKTYQSRDVLFGPSCEQVYEPTFKNMDYKTFNVSEFYSWVKDNYSIEQSDIKTYNKAGNNQEFSWANDGKNYWAYFEQGHIKNIAVDWISPQVNGNKVIECFGTPSHYLAYSNKDESGSTQFELQLFYPNMGLIARFGMKDMNKPADVTTPKISGNLPMTLAFFQPSTLEDISLDANFLGLTADWQNHLKVWPGSWNGMSFDYLQSP